MGSLFDHRLQHDMPYAYLASDAFLHYAEAEGTKDLGHSNSLPVFISAGLEDVAGTAPPLLSHFTAILYYLTSVQTYDLIYFLVFFFVLMTALIYYLTIRKYNKNIAILSVALAIMLFAPKFYSGFTFGQWHMYLGFFFLFALFWIFSRIELKYSFVLIGLFVSSCFLAHIVDLFWAVGFIAFYFIVKSIFKELDLKQIKQIIYSGLVFIITSLNLFLIFIFVFFILPEPEKKATSTIKVQKLTEIIQNYQPLFTNFGPIIITAIVIGVMISLFIFIKKKQTSLLPGFYMILASFGYILGFGKALQIRFVWPIIFSVFFSTTIYYALKSSIKNWKPHYSLFLSLALMILLTLIYTQPLNHPGIMDQYHWDMFNWINGKTAEKSNILFFYGDPYHSQTSRLYSTKRAVHKVELDYLKKALNNNTIDRVAPISIGVANLLGKPAYRKSFFSFEGIDFKETEMKDVCNFDYYVFDLIPQINPIPQLIEFNKHIRENLLKKEFIKEVYNNQVTSILINENKGAECLE